MKSTNDSKIWHVEEFVDPVKDSIVRVLKKKNLGSFKQP